MKYTSTHPDLISAGTYQLTQFLLPETMLSSVPDQQPLSTSDDHPWRH